MTNVNIDPFESLDDKAYIEYLERAEMYKEKGLLLDKNTVQLASELYIKDKLNESKND